MPGARQRHDAVDHAAPARRDQHQREHHAERLRPVRKRRVDQVMRTGPHVDRDQCPEVHDRQAVGVDRAARLLGHEVVHDSEEARGQEEADRVVAVPPLHHRVDHAGVGRVGLPQRDRHLRAVDDVQHGDRDDEGREEPVGNVDVLDAAGGERAEEDDRVGHPDDGDGEVDRPLELGVFLAGRDAQRQRDRGGQDDQLPAPERERRERRREEPHMAGTLDDVVGRREQSGSAEGEDHGVRVQGPQPPVRQPGDVEVKGREQELRRDEHADGHPDDSPDQRHQGELPDDPVAIGGLLVHAFLADTVATGRRHARSGPD